MFDFSKLTVPQVAMAALAAGAAAGLHFLDNQSWGAAGAMVATALACLFTKTGGAQ